MAILERTARRAGAGAGRLRRRQQLAIIDQLVGSAGSIVLAIELVGNLEAVGNIGELVTLLTPATPST